MKPAGKHLGELLGESNIDTAHNSASLSKANRDVKELKAENKKLKQELEDVKLLYSQLVKENTHEQFDERRVNFLKSQVIQLERQMLLLSEGLSSRGSCLMDVDNALVQLADTCRTFIAKDIRGPEVPVPRAELTRMVETIESSRIKLFKNTENVTTEKLAKPLLFMSDFVKHSPSEPVTLLEVCSGNLDHINLKHVAKLESKLTNLYKQLTRLKHSLDTTLSLEATVIQSASHHLSSVVFDELSNNARKSCDMLKDCCQDLLSLSVVIPNAPLPPLTKPILKDMTVDNVIAALPKFPKVKQKEGRQMIGALLKAFSYHSHILGLETKAVKEELKVHRSLYQLQVNYAESLFQAVREGYKTFEESTEELVCKPLKSTLEAYEELRDTASEQALKNFLSTFKSQADQLSQMIETLTPKENSAGQEALSSFGTQFMESLENHQKACKEKLDKLSEEVEILKEQKRVLLSQELAVLGQNGSKASAGDPPQKDDQIKEMKQGCGLQGVEDRQSLHDPKNKTLGLAPEQHLEEFQYKGDPLVGKEIADQDLADNYACGESTLQYKYDIPKEGLIADNMSHSTSSSTDMVFDEEACSCCPQEVKANGAEEERDRNMNARPISGKKIYPKSPSRLSKLSSERNPLGSPTPHRAEVTGKSHGIPRSVPGIKPSGTPMRRHGSLTKLTPSRSRENLQQGQRTTAAVTPRKPTGLPTKKLTLKKSSVSSSTDSLSKDDPQDCTDTPSKRPPSRIPGMRKSISNN
ncbi:uncharacterized protein LOC106152590 isoform X2 [Lingula anatina]|uniref:Uncharacterized protein LOC106152590 isoform X2 n=1 Tax=Lingula anatina TaxID=7574 RepID=A0A1S3H981_LINAN|nr:uncharacterized protein LOC106152590 isoform X2 [Lingula anatina]|eukprot:XP_013381684.1 uncharacterized protein LOC106152590 isoform X2 [Lingula anatina]